MLTLPFFANYPADLEDPHLLRAGNSLGWPDSQLDPKRAGRRPDGGRAGRARMRKDPLEEIVSDRYRLKEPPD